MRDPALYAIVDVETTYGDPRRACVMEVAVILTDGRRELERWSSLVRPQNGGPIDPFVSMLTGITPAMLSKAPRFAEVVTTVQRMTAGSIVVAHNARFDMTALGLAFERCGQSFTRDTLCTEQLSRQFFPHLKFHNLNSLCRHMGIPARADHRALGDALACKAALEGVLERFGEDRVLSAMLPAVTRMRA
ncbi:MAG: 3'-5' exonuclease [Flavobacteriales bacterium]